MRIFHLFESLISKGRRGRPKQFEEVLKSEPNLVSVDPTCPFCPGNEYLTGVPVFKYRQGIASFHYFSYHIRESDSEQIPCGPSCI